MQQSFRLLIADDQARTRQSLIALLTIDFPQIEISEAANGNEALEQVGAVDPDVVVMDVLMPECDGIAATRSIKALHPRTKIILYSMYAEYQSESLAAGADAFIMKGDPAEILIAAVEGLARANTASGRSQA